MNSFFKSKGAAWLLSAALVGTVAGCGGGTSSQRPVASADAGEILFTVIRSGSDGTGGGNSTTIDRDLFSANLDGSNRTLIPTSAVRESDNPAWLPGRRELVYADSFMSRGGATSSIRRVNRDGSNDREIISSQVSGFVASLAVSPDGRRIAYSRIVGEFEIFVANADGTNPVRLTQGRYPSWSPDGQRLVFDDSVGNQSDLFSIKVDGSNRVRLTNSPENETDPEWSPDGKRIVFVSSPPNINDESEIVVANSNGSNRTRLTNTERPSFNPKWNADGRRILFISDRNGTGNTLFIMNADGSNQMQSGSAPIRVNDFDVR